eukprot:scaffold45306_cov270-Isochrysis_galbana.AAC.1
MRAFLRRGCAPHTAPCTPRLTAPHGAVRSACPCLATHVPVSRPSPESSPPPRSSIRPRRCMLYV